jgi:apolipoprotein D and lipocalin family protein
MLKLSFFGPFFMQDQCSGYHKDYKYALVSGDSLDYLWLSREKTIPDSIKEAYLETSTRDGL